jgi:SNF2 family DNA or RNA helicase
MFDVTVGLFSGSNTVAGASTGVDTNGKILFTSKSMMMREKINVYQQYAQLLLGNNASQFSAPFASTVAGEKIDEALFLSFRRLFHRDKIKRETFAMKFFQFIQMLDLLQTYLEARLVVTLETS